MASPDLNVLLALMTVARERSFTRAAAQLGMSQSAVSRTVRELEEKMGVLLLNRTTRSVSPTEAGQRLLDAISPKVEDIQTELESLVELRKRPAGAVRISATDYTANQHLWPKLRPLVHTHPDIQIEIANDYGLTNIVERRFDIGVRLGEQIAKDMIAVRVGPDETFAIVGAPSYLRAHSAPKTPRDLAGHNCINLRVPTMDSLLTWELRKGRRNVDVRVSGQLVFNNIYQILTAALEGFGLAYVPKTLAEPAVRSGQLQWVMEDWFRTFTGPHAYYPTRRQSSLAVRLVIEALRSEVP
ncbi:HTH-type transcriptional regulator DmlR [compost metagenome]